MRDAPPGVVPVRMRCWARGWALLSSLVTLFVLFAFQGIVWAGPAQACVSTGHRAQAYAYENAAHPAQEHGDPAWTDGRPAGRPSRAERRPRFVSEVGVAANAERGVAMGRNMADRVIPYAEKNGLDWYKGTPEWVPRTAIEKVSPRALEKTDLWFNKRWINNEMRGGSRIVDIGEPPGYPPSVFCNMERQQVSGYWNYVQDIQP